MEPNTDSTKTTPQRTRSPGYPTMNLEDAIEKVAALWEKAGKQQVGLDVVSEIWGLSPTSSSSPQHLATLKRYGLIDDVGDGKRRLVRLTPLAIKIIAHPKGSPDHQDALKKAALTPEIFGDLLQRYGDNLNVSDSLIRSHLIVDRDFNKDVVDRLIKSFRDTITYADLKASDASISKESDQSSDESPGKLNQPPQNLLDKDKISGDVMSQQREKLLDDTIPKMREFTLPMPNGGIYIRVPVPFSEEDFETFKKSLDLFKNWLIASGEASKKEKTDKSILREELEE